MADVQDTKPRPRPPPVVLAELRDRIAADLARSGGSVEQFIADRRAEAARDAT